MIEKFTPAVRARVGAEFELYLNMFEEAGVEMDRIAPKVATAFVPEQSSAPAWHNHYVDLLCSCYAAKYILYSNQLVTGVNRFDFLAYASAGRSFVEMTAVLRHFLRRKYKPFFDTGMKTGKVDLRKVIEIHDQHLRGTRFDWDRWMSGELGKLFEEAQVRHSKKPDEKLVASIQTKQINVTTCVEKWASEAPAVLVLYDLFCDLVHPNMGSNLAVASVEHGQLMFGSVTPNVAAVDLFIQTFPWLLSVCGKSFGTYIVLLQASRYAPDELASLN